MPSESTGNLQPTTDTPFAARGPGADADRLALARRTPRRKPIAKFEDSQGVVRKVLRPLAAVRAKCMDCCCESWLEVKRCPAEDCALWPYRFGHRPQKADVVVFDSMTKDKQMLKEAR